MIILSLLLTMQVDPATQRPLTGPPIPQNLTEVKLNECLDLAVQDPNSGIINASEWKINGGSFFADHCLGFAYAVDFKFDAAMAAFDNAAQAASLANDDRAARFWLQAANAAIAAEKPTEAIGYVDSALATGGLEGVQLGEAHLDKARAMVALKLEERAKEELILAQKFVPQDPLVWLLSATLNRRLGDTGQARADIDVAARLAPKEPSVALEQGNIEIVDGNFEAAEAHWRNAIAIKSDGRVADNARALLKQLEDNIIENSDENGAIDDGDINEQSAADDSGAINDDGPSNEDDSGSR